MVQFAEHLFLNGDQNKNIAPRDFDRVYAVFDRDDHESYHNALSKMASLNGRWKNRENSKVSFKAIASVPCFELWLLLHFEDVQAPVERTQIYERLQRYLPDYDKGQSGYWASTKLNLSLAIERAKIRQNHSTAHDGVQPYTDMDRLVQKLIDLNQRYSA